MTGLRLAASGLLSLAIAVAAPADEAIFGRAEDVPSFSPGFRQSVLEGSGQWRALDSEETRWRLRDDPVDRAPRSRMSRGAIDPVRDRQRRNDIADATRNLPEPAPITGLEFR